MSITLLVLFLIVLILSVIGYAFFTVPAPRQIWMIHRLPGPWYPPVIGAAHELPFIKVPEIMYWFKSLIVDGYDRVAAVWVAGVPFVNINNPEDIEVVLSSSKHINKGIEYITFEHWLQEGLLISTGNKWHTRRKLLTPTFHFKILNDKSKMMYVTARKFVQRLLETNGQPFDASKKISSCTLDIIGGAGRLVSLQRIFFLETAMGVALNSQDGLNSDYVVTLRRVIDATIYRVLNVYLFKPWVWALSSVGAKNFKDVRTLQNFTSKIIARRRDDFKENIGDNIESDNDIGEKKRQDFLDKLLELDATMKGQFTDSDIREEVDTFLFEGHDTTAALILFALFELGHNPNIQDLAYKEQYGIFGNDERAATMDDLQNMNYLERFIKECLRLYPSVPYISRFVKEDLHLKDLPPIPADSNIIIMPYFLHRNPKYYPDPEKFNPDRFLPAECTKRHPFSYIPFSAGPRNCIGQKFAMLELKTLLSTVIRLTRVESVTEKSELQLVPVIILRPVSPILIRVLPRS